MTKRIKQKLKGLVERSKLEFLTGTKSLPIESKSSKKIAIKVIDYRGNELLSVFKLNENE
ncbi:MAG: DNA methyltransferase [Promethearchaeota archaeon]